MSFIHNVVFHKSVLLLVTCYAAATPPLMAETIVDDFGDGQWDDGKPIDWSVTDGVALSASITSENSLRLDSSAGLIRVGASSATDTASIRIRGRVESSFLGLSFPNQGHWTTLGADGALLVGQGNDTIFDSVSTGLDPLLGDVIVQMDWIDDTVSAWAWDPDNPPTSETPMAIYVTTRTRSFPSVFTNFGAAAEYQFIAISDQHIPVVVPEPTGLSLTIVGIAFGTALVEDDRWKSANYLLQT